MNNDLINQFITWNGSVNIPCCLIQCTGNDSYAVTAYNTAFFNFLKIDGNIDSLDNVIKIKQHLDNLIFNNGAKEWTEYSEELNTFIDCQCQLIKEKAYALWITAAEHKSTDILGNIPIGIIRMRVAHGSTGLRCSYINSKALSMIPTSGRDAGNLLQTSKIMHVHDADASAVEQTVAAFIGGGDGHTFECRLCPPEAQCRWIRASLAWIIPQKLLQIAFVDISSEKQTEEHNRQNQLLLQKILDTTQAAIFWKDAERRFIGVNKAFLEYYGFDSVDVLRGKNDEDMGWHSDPDPYKNDELRVLQGETTTRVPGMCFCKGENRHIVASKSPLLENDKIVGLVGSFEDVTNEVRLRNDVIELNSRLKAALENERQANHAKSEFLLRMSHDMRTPLTTIIGFSDLELQKNHDPDLIRVFSTIKSCSNFLLAILSDILDLQKISKGKVDIRPTICTGAESAKNIEAIIRPQAEAKKINFIAHFNCASTNCHVQIDTRKVQQIIVNLLNNAVKYTQPGGTITWRTVISGEEGDNLSVTHVISDNGPGISKKFQARMYAPFTQESSSPSSGSGLGLAIVKKLVDLLGGSIACNSAPGQGTTFTVVLPHKKANEIDITEYYAQKNRQTDTNGLKGKTVLICEDNTINSQILKELLEGEGMTCDLAVNGREAVTMARSARYHIILMDIRMPLMDGYEATRAIRDFDMDTPIVALSANALSDEKQTAFESGMDDFLEKPIVLPLLFSTLGQFLSAPVPTP